MMCKMEFAITSQFVASPPNFLTAPLSSESHQSATRCIYHQCADSNSEIALLCFYIVHTAASASDVKTVLHLELVRTLRMVPISDLKVFGAMHRPLTL